MKTKELIKIFENFDLTGLQKYLPLISSKTNDDQIFKPYIPLVGKKYDKAEKKILLYATAQNLSPGNATEYCKNMNKLTERLYYPWDDFSKKYPENGLKYYDISISPYASGVLPALIGVFLYAQFKIAIKNLSQIHDHVAISNYYKFSFNKGSKDIHPNNLKDPTEYYKLNDDLVEAEIKVLQPDYIFSFRGRHHNDCLKMKQAKTMIINDPSWILQGGGGCLKDSGSWGQYIEDLNDKRLDDIVEGYLQTINEDDSLYKGKISGIRIYLKRYYKEWQKNL
jgi:hypothetical protein